MRHYPHLTGNRVEDIRLLTCLREGLSARGLAAIYEVPLRRVIGLRKLIRKPV